ncbi:MAG: PspC domain-containing protein [Bacteroidia bacterium]|nr:PspC domain-containing protein [Bacteroidia bacterium]
MKRTVDVNLNGIHFVIDEDAYSLLEQYINDLEAHFSKEEERDVVTDIEARIAELFSDSLIHGRNVVDIETTRQTLDRIGRPEQMDDNNGDNYDTNNTQYNKSEKDDTRNYTNNTSDSDLLNKFRSVKLYRDTDDVMVAGVCSGIALRAHTEAWIIRLAVVLLSIFTNGPMLLAYLAMWILMPKAITVAQKLEMRGEPADINSIQNFKSEPVQRTEAQNAFGTIVKIGIILLICSYVFTGCNALGLASIFAWGPFNFVYGCTPISHPTWEAIKIISTIVTVLLPLITAIVWLFRRIFNNPYKPFSAIAIVTLWLVWIAAFVMAIVALCHS